MSYIEATKQVLIVFLFSLVLSCSGTKQTVKSTEKPQEKVELSATKTQDTVKMDVRETAVASGNENIEAAKKTDTLLKQTADAPPVKPHKIWDLLLQKHVSDTGIVNYIGFGDERKKLLDYLSGLDTTFTSDAFKTFTEGKKLAFWINAYNAMTVDLILRHYPVKSIKDIKDPWKQRHWKLGSKWYNLDEIEHKIIRKMGEPRIHFALVCAAKSCPKLYNKAFTASTLDDDLTKLTKAFLADSTKNKIEKNSLQLSKIFQWFAKDFKANGQLVDFLNQYSDIEISAKAKKSFKTYDWGLNE